MTSPTDLRALADAFFAAEKAYYEKLTIEAGDAYINAKRKFKRAATPEAIIGLLDRIKELEAETRYLADSFKAGVAP